MHLQVDKLPAIKARPYDEVRPNLRSGDLLMCSGSSFFSNIIQRATRSPWSHVAFILVVREIGRVMVMESLEGFGVRTVPLSQYLTDYDRRGNRYDGELYVARHRGFAAARTEELLAMARFAVDQLAREYDKTEIARIAWRLGAGETGPVTRNQAYICSEYVEECYRRCGIEIPYNERGFIAPADFARDPGFQVIARLA